MKSLRNLALLTALAIGLAGCASEITPAPPVPAPEGTPTPEAKPTGVVPKYISQEEAETLCTLKAVKKFGVGLGDVKVTGTRKVDAGYRTTLSIGGQEKTCILTPHGDLRSLI